MLKDQKDYYVYEYIRLDTNQPFYIGKGRYRRWRDLINRNKHFKNIVNKVSVACVILHENLTDGEACEIECWYIWQLRDILGYSLVNETDGGDGTAGHKHTEQYKKDRSSDMKKYWKDNKDKMCGCNNPNYGKKGENNHNFGRKRPEHSKLISGENHPRARTVLIMKGNKIIQSFKTVKELFTYVKENFQPPNSEKISRRYLNNSEDLQGFKLIYEDQLT